MVKTYEFRIYPTRPQEKRLQAVLRVCRDLYNWAIENRRDMWKRHRLSQNYVIQASHLKYIKKEMPWMKIAHSHALQNTLKKVEKAFYGFGKRVKAGQEPGFPRFKSSSQFKTFVLSDFGKRGAKFDGKRLYVSKIGRIRIRLHREIEGKIKTCSIKQRADGWYALLAVDGPNPVKREIKSDIGVDVGLASFVTLSNGEKIGNPRLLNKAERGLKMAHRSMMRKKNGSRRREKAARIYARKCLRLSRARRDFHKKVASALVKKYDRIYVERLNIEGMKKSRFARGISDISWGHFLSFLEFKAESAGALVLRVPARGTTQECSKCHKAVPKTTRDRIHKCPHCGLVEDRDVNAAINILDRGRAAPSGRSTLAAALQ
ncbi:MAG: transposase [Kiritimatiellae bacterium]|nr:transposase [Kiritimatiellia bacterium]